MSSLIAPTGRLNLVHMNFDEYGIDFSDAWMNNFKRAGFEKFMVSFYLLIGVC